MSATSHAPPLRVFTRPAWDAPNPYPGMLADALVREGAQVEELGLSFRAIPPGRAILVYHWPDEFFFVRGASRAMRALVLIGRIWLGKMFERKRLVWIAHNVRPHRREGRPFKLGMALFFGAVDGLIFLSQTSREVFVAAHPDLARRPFVVIAHGHYRARATTSPTLPPPVQNRPVRLAFTGQIRAYKAPDLLARTVAALSADEVSLVVSGDCIEAALRQELERVAAAAANVTVDIGRLSDAGIEAIVDGADAIVLPYRDILNSGTALLALSRARPVIAPRLGSLTDLERQVGKDWLWLYDGELTPDVLAAGLAWVRTTRRTVSPDLSEHEWVDIGSKVAQFLAGLDGARVRAPDEG